MEKLQFFLVLMQKKYMENSRVILKIKEKNVFEGTFKM